jgi:hypothetical protein
MGIDITGLGTVADAAKTIVNKFFPDKMGDADRAKMELELQSLLSARDTAVLDAQKSVMVAELNQGDAYTKRARPTIIYGGLVFIFLVHVFCPMVAMFTGKAVPGLILPDQFWWAWGSMCSIYAIGRTAEKNGINNKAVGMITGSWVGDKK